MKKAVFVAKRKTKVKKGRKNKTRNFIFKSFCEIEVVLGSLRTKFSEFFLLIYRSMFLLLLRINSIELETVCLETDKIKIYLKLNCEHRRYNLSFLQKLISEQMCYKLPIFLNLSKLKFAFNVNVNSFNL